MLPKGLVPYRVSVDQYAAMVARGIFTKQDRLELIEGMLVRKMTKGRRHSRASENCRRAIERALPEGWHLEVEKPVRLPLRSSMPEPDLFVARGEVDDYEDLDPGPPDVALVVEVSDTTLAADRALAATYLNGGIPSYWIVNLPERTLEVYTAAGREILAEDADVTLFVDDQPIARLRVADFLAGRKTE
ncbi:Uma2 family endonuclease [Aquisphaera insulae]|uniref:Uma2 family endonuclease n=1 Tax=Aquisphaera insulae TaxID=2712864 RepID=UPI0013EB5EA6|nr:Uma2 family endonuclease [Aquisphaera insulae]